MPGMNAVGTNTEASTRAIPTTGPESSFIALRAASFGANPYHTGHLLFDRRSDGLLESLCVGTGVVSLQPDFRRRNVRKLCDWQKRNRDRANDDGKGRDHNRDDGASDEKTRHN